MATIISVFKLFHPSLSYKVWSVFFSQLQVWLPIFLILTMIWWDMVWHVSYVHCKSNTKVILLDARVSLGHLPSSKFGDDVSDYHLYIFLGGGCTRDLTRGWFFPSPIYFLLSQSLIKLLRTWLSWWAWPQNYDLPVSASRVDGIIDICHHSQLYSILINVESFLHFWD